MSRFDLQGFFWQDEERIGRGKAVTKVLPTIPESSWKPPATFPNLSSAKIIGLDTETYDPNLKTHGPGWARNDGHVVGISLSVEEKSWYFPIRHELQKEMNMPVENVFRFLNDCLQTNVPKVGANLQYDVGWLKQEGVTVNGRLYDVQFAEALLNDVAKDYSLDTIAKNYLGTGKVSKDLYSWCARAYGGNPTGKQRENIYRAPVTLVGPYAEADAHEPFLILQKQFELLKEAELWDLFELECRLIPLLIDMRFRGMPVNLEKAEEAKLKLFKEEEKAQNELNALAGFDINVYSNDDLQHLFDAKGIEYPLTAKGNPSFTQPWLDNNNTMVADRVNSVRKLQKARVTFIENGILEKHVNGFVHPSFHPLRGEEGGAVSGRFSSSNPNAQQIPSRDKFLAPLIRGLFVPEEFYNSWLKLDLSQIEYRMFAHESEDEHLIAEYQDQGTDYHNVVSQMLGNAMPRPIVKNFNFMSIYGGGKERTIAMIGNNLDKPTIKRLCEKENIKVGAKSLGNHFVKLYAERFPAAKYILNKIGNIASITGEVRTILNRRNTFNLWESARKHGTLPLPYSEAYDKYGPPLKRANTYKALNRKLQGSAADLLKKGMVDAYEQGLFKTIGVPHVTVHDELDFSFHPDLNKEALAIKECIETAVPLRVPVIMDAEIGTDWGNVKEYNLNSGVKK